MGIPLRKFIRHPRQAPGLMGRHTKANRRSRGARRLINHPNLEGVVGQRGIQTGFLVYLHAQRFIPRELKHIKEVSQLVRVLFVQGQGKSLLLVVCFLLNVLEMGLYVGQTAGARHVPSLPGSSVLNLQSTCHIVNGLERFFRLVRQRFQLVRRQGR